MDGVVLLHGIANVPLSMLRLERALRADGYATRNLRYPSRRMKIDALAGHLAPEIARFAAGLDGRLNFVCPSMGGLVALRWIARSRPENLGRVVMLGAPNAGSEVADFLHERWVYRRIFGPAGSELTTAAAAARRAPAPCPIGIIAGDRGLGLFARFVLPRPNDGKVSVAATKLDGMADHLVVPTNHTLLPFDGRVVAQVRHFLRNGAFSRAGGK